MVHYRLADLFPHLGLDGPDLLLRQFGQQAFPILEEWLHSIAPGTALVLDSADVRVMDSSFADEAIIELALGLVGGRFDDRFLILADPTEATCDNIEGTIARRKAKLALLVRSRDRTSILGHLEANLTEAWRLTYGAGEITARDLANKLGLEINTASTRLLKLHQARLLARTEVMTSTGRQHIYRLPA